MKNNTLTWDEFIKVDIRVGTIMKVEDFPEARNPSYKLFLDFGKEIGTKKSSAQITALYNKKDLLGKQVLAVINFPPKQIGPFMSECLVTGLGNDKNDIVLISPEFPVPNGKKLL